MPVILLPPAPADENELITAVRRSRDLHDPWSTPPNSPEVFARWQSRVHEPGEAPRLARLRPDGDAAPSGAAARPGPIVGVANLSRIDRRGLMSAYAGWYGLEGFTGRGLMTQAVARLLDLAFGEFGLNRVEANIQPGNHPSRRLAARLGFRLEGFSPRYLRIGGIWRDHERWAILSDEWEIGGGPPDLRRATGVSDDDDDNDDDDDDDDDRETAPCGF